MQFFYCSISQKEWFEIYIYRKRTWQMMTWLLLIFHYRMQVVLDEIIFFLLSQANVYFVVLPWVRLLFRSLCFHGSSFHLVSLSYSHRRVRSSFSFGIILLSREGESRKCVTRRRKRKKSRNESAWNEYGVHRNETRERNNTYCE